MNVEARIVGAYTYEIRVPGHRPVRVKSSTKATQAGALQAAEWAWKQCQKFTPSKRVAPARRKNSVDPHKVDVLRSCACCGAVGVPLMPTPRGRGNRGLFCYGCGAAGCRRAIGSCAAPFSPPRRNPLDRGEVDTINEYATRVDRLAARQGPGIERAHLFGVSQGSRDVARAFGTVRNPGKSGKLRGHKPGCRCIGCDPSSRAKPDARKPRPFSGGAPLPLDPSRDFDFEGAILDDQDARYELNPRRPRKTKGGSAGSGLVDGFLNSVLGNPKASAGRKNPLASHKPGCRCIGCDPSSRAKPGSRGRRNPLTVVESRKVASLARADLSRSRDQKPHDAQFSRGKVDGRIETLLDFGFVDRDIMSPAVQARLEGAQDRRNPKPKGKRKNPLSSHKPACGCFGCRAARGEPWSDPRRGASRGSGRRK